MMQSVLGLLKTNKLSVGIISAGLILITLSFQNCGKQSDLQSDEIAKQLAEDAAADNANRDINNLVANNELLGGSSSCFFDGKEIANGESVQAFQNSSVTQTSSGSTEKCISQNRVCKDGVLSGSYRFSSCTLGELPSCVFNNVTVKSGTAITGFKEVIGSNGVKTCEQKSLICNSGNLSDAEEYPFAVCAAGIPKRSCTFDGLQLAHGAPVKGFVLDTSTTPTTCKSLDMACNDGTVAGSTAFPFSACPLDAAKALASSMNTNTMANSAMTETRVCLSTPDTQTAQLSCPSGSYIKSIEFASYGTPMGSCGDYRISGCNDTNTMPLVQKTCLNKESCSILASTAVFKNMCGVALKRLNLQVTCTTVKPAAINSGAPCMLNGKSVASGESLTVYKIKSGICPLPGSADAPKVTCVNGVIGTNYLPFNMSDFKYDSCTDVCELKDLSDKVTKYANGKSVTAYKFKNSDCSNSIKLTCSNSSWGAKGREYTYNKCQQASSGSSGSVKDGTSSTSSGGSSSSSGSSGSSSSSSGGSKSGSSGNSSSGSVGDVYFSGSFR